MIKIWMTMIYKCDRCGAELLFHLEDGCEGPRDGEPLKGLEPAYPGGPTEWPRTKSGRQWIPVPFCAGTCPECKSGYLQHVRWAEDRVFPEQIELPDGVPHFLYRDPGIPGQSGYDSCACGEPVF
jgi:hypothetical protein